MKLVDEGDGRYVGTYTIPANASRDDRALVVRLRRDHIHGSPFSVRVVVGRNFGHLPAHVG